MSRHGVVDREQLPECISQLPTASLNTSASVPTVLVHSFILGQQPSKREHPTSFLVQLGYLKADSIYSASSACIAVLPDSHYHLEKSWRYTDFGFGGGMQVFEGTLSDENLRSLSAVLAVDDLKRLKAVEGHLHFRLQKGGLGEVMEEGEVVRALIPRPEGPQDISLGGFGTLPKRRTPWPAAVNPLVPWIRTTSKQVEMQKGSLIKGGKAVDCWLQEL